MKKQTKLNKIRRIKSKTNYNKRLKLLKSEKPRLVIRKTNKYIILQIIQSQNAKDKIIAGITTKELLKQGWPEEKKGSLKSLSAAYLGGYLLGKKSEIPEVILDTGLIPNTKASRVYAALKGISDAGIKINFDEKIIPSEEKLKQFDFIDNIKNNIRGKE